MSLCSAPGAQLHLRMPQRCVHPVHVVQHRSPRPKAFSARSAHVLGLSGRGVRQDVSLRLLSGRKLGGAVWASARRAVRFRRWRLGSRHTHKYSDVPISALALAITDGHHAVSGSGVSAFPLPVRPSAHHTAVAWPWHSRKYIRLRQPTNPEQSNPAHRSQPFNQRTMDAVRQRLKSFDFVKVRSTVRRSIVPSGLHSKGGSHWSRRSHHLLPPVLSALQALCEPSQVRGARVPDACIC